MTNEHHNDNPANDDPAASPTHHSSPTAAPAPSFPAPTATMPRPQTPPPAAPASSTKPRRRSLTVLGAVALAVVSAFVFTILMVMAVIVGVVIGAAAEADVVDIEHTPTAVTDIPNSVDVDQADVVIDLTELSATDFAGQAGPVDVDVDVDFGSVRVIVPEGLNVDVNAKTEVGSTEVFDRNNDGFDNRVEIEDGGQTDIDFTIDVGLGEIEVERR